MKESKDVLKMKLKQYALFLNDAEKQMLQRRRQFAEALLRFHQEGLTYDELAETSGKSRSRIEQILRQERVRA